MLTAYYDLARNPPTYDFVTFLMRVEALRLERQEKDVEIHVLPGPDEGFRLDNLWPRGGEARRKLLNNIVVPMAALLPACRRVTVHDDRPHAANGSFGHNKCTIPFRNFTLVYGKDIRPLRSPDNPQREPDLVTITLRESEHWTFRNSYNKVWLEAAYSLGQDYRIVFVRDTSHADEPLPLFKTDPEASRDLLARARLYSRAAVNFFVSNGPAWLALALDAPAIIFRPIADQGPHFFREVAGVQRGGQMPNAPPYQRLVWEEETTGRIVEMRRMATEMAA
jgi:hypothetical protein